MEASEFLKLSIRDLPVARTVCTTQPSFLTPLLLSPSFSCLSLSLSYPLSLPPYLSLSLSLPPFLLLSLPHFLPVSSLSSSPSIPYSPPHLSFPLFLFPFLLIQQFFTWARSTFFPRDSKVRFHFFAQSPLAHLPSSKFLDGLFFSSPPCLPHPQLP